MAQTVKRLPATRETQVQSLGWEDPLEKEMATHSSTLAWKIPYQVSRVGYSPWDCKESDTSEQLHFTLVLRVLCSVLTRVLTEATGIEEEEAREAGPSGAGFVEPWWNLPWGEAESQGEAVPWEGRWDRQAGQ